MTHTLKHPAQAARGFTLIELMVVVSIIGILAALAYPNYTEYVARGKRGKAQSALLEAAQFMQRYYAANNRYDKNLSGLTIANTDVAAAVTNGADLHYDIKVTAGANSYTLTAERKTAGLMASDKCGNFTLDQTGLKGQANATASLADCWK
jgi:type IV pilus assembly protein PilE